MGRQGFILGGVAQALPTRTLPDDQAGRPPALEIHRPAAMGLPRIPSDVIKFTCPTDNFFLGLHGENGA